MLALDIETVPLAASLAAPYDPEAHSPPANYKSAEAIAGWHEKNALAWQKARVKECSLNPRLGRIVAFSFASKETPAGAASVAVTEADEKDLLIELWHLVGLHQQIATWNGKGFDLPFIVVRSLILGVFPKKIEPALYVQRYQHIPHFDVKAALMGGDVRRAGEGLDEWSKALGLDGKTGTGADVYGLVVAEKWQALEAYAAQDAVATLAIARRAAPFFDNRIFVG